MFVQIDAIATSVITSAACECGNLPYREGLQARDSATRTLGFILPAVGVQMATHRIAQTDLAAQLAYQDRIRAFHERLRRFYYPDIFEERRFDTADYGKAPR